jgi:hypothetical protein
MSEKMSRIDAFYKQIGDKIDNSISELEAIKNYPQARDELKFLKISDATLQRENKVLQSNYEIVLGNVSKFRETNEGLKKYTEDLIRKHKAELLEKEKEINKLKQALDLWRAGDSGPKAEEQSKD